MKALHVIPAALFLGIAYIQLNDPDPLYWIIVYGGTATTAFARALGKSSDFWTTILIGAVAAGMVIATPSLVEFIAAGEFAAIGDMDRAPYIESAREFGGLLLALSLLLYYYKR